MISNFKPVDGWHWCQSSLQSEAAAGVPFTLYIDDKLITPLANVELKFIFGLYVDSTIAISNVLRLLDLIPKRW